MSNDRLMSRFQEDLTRNEECVRLMDKPKMRGNIAGKLALGDSSSGFAPEGWDRFVNETPYTKRDLYILPRSMGKSTMAEEEARASGRQLGKYPDPIRLIDVNSKRELRIPGEAFPDGLVNPRVELCNMADQSANWGSSNTIGFIRVNGTEYPIISVDSIHSGLGMNDDDLLFQIAEEEYIESSYREPVIDSFSQLRPGYKGGNTPNLFKSMGPCSKVNPKDVAKRRAKNKAVRKNKRK